MKVDVLMASLDFHKKLIKTYHTNDKPKKMHLFHNKFYERKKLITTLTVEKSITCQN